MRRHPGEAIITILLIAAGWYSTRHRIDLSVTSTLRSVMVDGNIYVQWIAEGGTGSANPTWEEIAPDVTESAEPGDRGIDDELDWCEADTPPKATGRHRWRLPRIHKDFCSPIGTLWTVILPFWFLALVAVLLPMLVPALIRKLKSVRNDTEMIDIRRKWFMRCFAMFTITLALWIASMLSWFGGSSGNHDQFELNRGVFEAQFGVEPYFFRFEGDAYLNAGFSGVYLNYFWPEYTFALPHTEFCAQSSFGAWTAIVVPLWPVPAFFSVATALLFRQPSKVGLCRKCHYDLTGNTSGRCPECGERIQRCAEDAARLHERLRSSGR